MAATTTNNKRKCAKRQANVAQATPPWVDKAAIKAIYAEAKKKTKETGTPHQVDHAVPLQHPRVCGLHVPANLQVVREGANKGKGNRFTVEIVRTGRLTPKQEAFCLRYVETGNASEAYRKCYDAGGMKPATVNRSAFDLLENPKIAARLASLREAHADRHAVTVDSITAELEEARLLALDSTQPSAAISASLGKAKLHGLLVDKAEITGKDGGPIAMSDAKAALLRGIVPDAAGE